ncbi:MAG: type IV pilus biogenesis/stability protein PilW [Piscinibacter sp.]|nr:type IV pilus biogenesis/stability protein PilW [Piscinibacter sp.]
MTARWLTAASIALALLAGCSTTSVSTTSVPTTEPPRSSTTPAEAAAADAARRARVRLELATAYFSRGQMNVALDEVKLALAADPNLVAAHNLRGLIYANLGEPGPAEESFRRALALNPNDFDAMQNFGWFLCQQKRYPDADAQFEQALAVPQNREPSRTLLAQGVCRAFAGQLEPAERSLQRSYEIDPNNPSTSVNLAELLLRRGEPERARFYIRRVISQPPLVSAQTLWLAARIEHKLGNLTGARELGNQLHSRFADSREAAAFDKGQFDE